MMIPSKKPGDNFALPPASTPKNIAAPSPMDSIRDEAMQKMDDEFSKRRKSDFAIQPVPLDHVSLIRAKETGYHPAISRQDTEHICLIKSLVHG